MKQKNKDKKKSGLGLTVGLGLSMVFVVCLAIFLSNVTVAGSVAKYVQSFNFGDSARNAKKSELPSSEIVVKYETDDTAVSNMPTEDTIIDGDTRTGNLDSTVPEKTGYTFLGWTDGSTETVSWTDTKDPNSSMTGTYGPETNQLQLTNAENGEYKMTVYPESSDSTYISASDTVYVELKTSTEYKVTYTLPSVYQYARISVRNEDDKTTTYLVDETLSEIYSGNTVTKTAPVVLHPGTNCLWVSVSIPRYTEAAMAVEIPSDNAIYLTLKPVEQPKLYQPGEEYVVENGVDEVIMTPVFTESYYTVKIDYTGDKTGDGESYYTQSVKYNGSYTVPYLSAPAGYTCGNSVNTMADGSGVSYAANDKVSPITEDTTLYLTLTKKNYLLSFDSDGGSNVDSISVTFDEDIVIPDTTPTKDGYTFGGWQYTYTKWDYSTGTGVQTTKTIDIPAGTTIAAEKAWTSDSDNDYYWLLYTNAYRVEGSTINTLKAVWKEPTHVLKAGVYFNSLIPSSATSVVFTDIEMPSNATLIDVDDDKDGAVVAWMGVGTDDTTTMYVSTQKEGQPVVFNSSPWYNYRMFANKSNLTNVSFDNIDTSNVTNMGGMFYGCSKLTSLDLSNFDTSNVTNMASMFGACSKLTTLDLSAFNTDSVTDMYQMFYNCTALTGITFPENLSTSNVTYMAQMFYGCKNLETIDLSDFDTSNVTSMNALFASCQKLTSLEFPDTFKTSNVTNMGMLFSDCRLLTTLDLSGFDMSKTTNMNAMFNSCYKLTNITFPENIDTSNVTDMSSMFSGCTGLTSLDLSNFNTSEVTTMSAMFFECRKLTSLELNNFDTSKVTNMASMFDYCNNLTTLDLSSFDTNNVADTSYMFANCSNLTTIYASDKFNVDNVTNSVDMFYSNSNLVGSNGTAYSYSHSDEEYARLDLEGIPGYFSSKHSWYLASITDSTCTEEGLRNYMCSDDGCEETLSIVISALGHSPVNGICTRCGEDLKGQWILAESGTYTFTKNDTVWTSNVNKDVGYSYAKWTIYVDEAVTTEIPWSVSTGYGQQYYGQFSLVLNPTETPTITNNMTVTSATGTMLVDNQYSTSYNTAVTGTATANLVVGENTLYAFYGNNSTGGLSHSASVTLSDVCITSSAKSQSFDLWDDEEDTEDAVIESTATPTASATSETITDDSTETTEDFVSSADPSVSTPSASPETTADSDEESETGDEDTAEIVEATANPVASATPAVEATSTPISDETNEGDSDETE